MKNNENCSWNEDVTEFIDSSLPLEFIPQKFDKIHRMLDKNEIFPVDLILAVFDSKRSSYQKFEYFKNRKLMKSNCRGCLIFFWEFWMENRRYSSKSFDDALKNEWQNMECLKSLFGFWDTLIIKVIGDSPE